MFRISLSHLNFCGSFLYQLDCDSLVGNFCMDVLFAFVEIYLYQASCPYENKANEV